MNSCNNSIHPKFLNLDPVMQKDTLALIATVNKYHLHSQDDQVWQQVHYLITYYFAEYQEKKQKKKEAAAQLQAVAHPVGGQTQQPSPAAQAKNSRIIAPLTQSQYTTLLASVKSTLQGVFYDPLFTNAITEALQEHILIPLRNDAHLAQLLCNWIELNTMYLPLCTQLDKAVHALLPRSYDDFTI